MKNTAYNERFYEMLDVPLSENKYYFCDVGSFLKDIDMIVNLII